LNHRTGKSSSPKTAAVFRAGISAVLLILFSLLAASCSPAPVTAGALQPTNTPLAVAFIAQATYLMAPPDATATPTPFQPLPPTAMMQATGQPTVTPAMPPTFTPQATLSTTPIPITPPPPDATQQSLLEQPPEQINVLLLGSDQRPWDSGFRTDTIILVTLNSRLGEVNLTSFPRDLYLNLPGYGMGRINTAWTFGGYPLLSQTFQHNFGVRPDYYALIDFSSFKKIVDGLGGLTVNVGEAVSDYRNGYWVTIPAGPVKMDADDVLWYARTRKTTNDIARNRRQQEVLMAIFEKMLSIDAIRRAPEFYNLYKDSVTTDIGLLDVLKWLPFAAKIAQTRQFHQYYLTYKQVNDWITPEGAMVLLPNQQAVMQIIRKSQNLP
jgi:polyisoprenyl-teichoic acid--peptidoglycan teichoic acid transferase